MRSRPPCRVVRLFPVENSLVGCELEVGVPTIARGAIVPLAQLLGHLLEPAAIAAIDRLPHGRTLHGSKLAEGIRYRAANGRQPVAYP